MKESTKHLIEIIVTLTMVSGVIIPYEFLLCFGANLAEYLNQGKNFDWVYFIFFIIHLVLFCLSSYLMWSKKSPLNKI